jgi:hypothetical protein
MLDYDVESWHHNQQIHRTLVEFLIQGRHPEVAAALVDGAAEVVPSGKVGKPGRIYVDIPPAGYTLVATSDEIQQIIRRAAREVATGNFEVEPEIILRMKVLDVPDEGWNAEMKSLIQQYKGSNQGLVSELLAARNGRPVHTWNKLKYASASEIRVAQELEQRHILFFPLAVAVRAETGASWQDHREVDFLVCIAQGSWES